MEAKLQQTSLNGTCDIQNEKQCKFLFQLSEIERKWNDHFFQTIPIKIHEATVINPAIILCRSMGPEFVSMMMRT